MIAGILAGELKFLTSTSITGGTWLMKDYFLVAKIILSLINYFRIDPSFKKCQIYFWSIFMI